MNSIVVSGSADVAFASGLGPLLAATIAPVFNGRAYPNVIPERALLPHASYKLYTGEPQNALGGWVGIDVEQWQVDVYALTYAEVKAKASAARAALTNAGAFSATCDLVQDLYEDDVSQHRVLMLFTVLH